MAAVTVNAGSDGRAPMFSGHRGLRIAQLGVACLLFSGCGDDKGTNPSPGRPEHVWRVPQDAPTIWAGIDSASVGDTVVVASGTYNVRTWMKSGICLRGETGDPADVILDGQHGGYVFVCEGVDSTTVIKGITITGGGLGKAEDGGGLLCQNSSFLTLRNCVFSGNMSRNAGGGLRCFTSSPTVENCLFVDNEPGAALFWKSSGNLRNCTFTRNEGFGVYCWLDAFPSITNCCIVGNSGEAIDCHPGAVPSIVCCDIYGNDGGDWAGCIAEHFGVSGNISADPLFCDPESGDFHLQTSSPCAPSEECGLIGALGVRCEGR